MNQNEPRCERCDEVFPTEDSLRKHNQEEHQGQSGTGLGQEQPR